MKIGNIKSETSIRFKNMYYAQVEWLLGVFILGIGQLLNALALKFGNIMLIASTSCVTIIISAVLSPLVLGERFFWKSDGITIMLIASGSICAVTQQPKHLKDNILDDSEGTLTEQLRAKFFTHTAIAYACLLGTILTFRFLARKKLTSVLNSFYDRTL
eukprot:CAMPEP_0170490864 /NCGR_PEP_ID=MMETSP0208-20121228/9924_1 /TAXON_ID=197538 /ORGANISM="Strombidium inclinatum, Strain S3" /LENGTH=158 /DNA_ID=CAMNT_0010766335 /DNA_START=90 /DNA_END=566 /DNA_ORIENTATION=+